MTAEAFAMDLVGCARCGGDGHPDLLFHPYTHPVECEEIEFTHWAICPTLKEPILFATVEKDSG